MINRPHYIQHPLKFYESVVSRKHKNNKELLRNAHQCVTNDFIVYIGNAIARNWHKHKPVKLPKSWRKALLGCYRYNVPEIVAMRMAVMDKGYGIIDSVCPCCTIDSYSTMDHYLPKELFPIHAVNPLNLMPCCQVCNDYKGTKVRGKNGERLFLNLYSDILPREQYLFVEFKFINDLPNIVFKVENRNGIDPELFALIKSHYKGLHLLERFARASGKIVQDLAITIRNHSARMADEAVKEEIEADAEALKRSFGYNFWEAILKISCAKDSAMYNYLKSIIF